MRINRGEKLKEKFANISPKLTSNNANPLLDFMFTADPTVEYNGRIYVYATNDHQQYEKVGGWEKWMPVYSYTGHDKIQRLTGWMESILCFYL